MDSFRQPGTTESFTDARGIGLRAGPVTCPPPCRAVRMAAWIRSRRLAAPRAFCVGKAGPGADGVRQVVGDRGAVPWLHGRERQHPPGSLKTSHYLGRAALPGDRGWERDTEQC